MYGDVPDFYFGIFTPHYGLWSCVADKPPQNSEKLLPQTKSEVFFVVIIIV